MDLTEKFHPVLGNPTLNVGKISGGTSINMIPDETHLFLDIRTTPAWTEKQALKHLESLVDQHTRFETLLNLPAVVSDFNHPWIQLVFQLVGENFPKNHQHLGLSYFTDAALLTPYFGNVPTVLMGPGDPVQAHAVDEYCSISDILQARNAYYKIAADWCDIPV